MTQAVKDYFFNNYNYNEVYSYMNKDNVASYKIAEKNGIEVIDKEAALKIAELRKKKYPVIQRSMP